MKRLTSRFKTYVKMTKQTLIDFNTDGCFSLAAALSYYTVFSLAPLLVIIIAVTSLFLGDEAVTGEIYTQIRGLVGAESAKTIQDLIERAYQPERSVWASIIGVATLIFGATSVFTQLQFSLNTIWNVEAKPQNGF